MQTGWNWRSELSAVNVEPGSLTGSVDQIRLQCGVDLDKGEVQITLIKKSNPSAHPAASTSLPLGGSVWLTISTKLQGCEKLNITWLKL